MASKADRPIQLMFSSVHCLLDPTSGAARSVRTMLGALQASGIKCTAFTGSAFDSPAIEHSPDFFSRLGAQMLPQSVAANLMHVSDDPFRHYVTPLPTTNRSLLSLQAEEAFAHEAVAFLGVAKPDILMVYGSGLYERALLRRCRAMGLKTLFYLTNPTHTDPATFEHVDCIVTDSKATQAFYRDRMGLSLQVVGKFIVPPLETPRMQGDDVLFINPLPEKGVMPLLAIAQECARRSLKFRFRIVESRYRLKDAISQAGLSGASLENIICVPGGSSLDAHFEAAKILLLPSLWNESGSRSLLEACSHGVPVIASDRGGTPELLGKGGMTLPIDPALDGRDWAMPSQETVALWADAIERLMTDSDFYKVRQTAALKRWRAYKMSASTLRMKRQIERLVS
ncbi:MAG: glycosyltransferase [Hyphomicrobiales bacterium]